MTDRMFISYASWVSFDFKSFVDDIFIRNTGGSISESGLILPNDKLHFENNEVNRRHGNLIGNIRTVPTNLKCPDDKSRSIESYVEFLRESYNLDISVEQLLKWYCYMGVFYKDGLCHNWETYDMYKPRDEYRSVLFPVMSLLLNGKEVLYVVVNEDGHNALIRQLTSDFKQIDSE